MTQQEIEVFLAVEKLGLTVRRLENGPADEIIYYLRGPHRAVSYTHLTLPTICSV